MNNYLKRFIMEKYGMDLKRVYLYGGGFENEIYFVESKDKKLTLRLYKEAKKDINNLNFQFDILDFLYKNNIPVQEPIQAVNGSAALKYKKDKVIQLLSYIFGNSAFPITPARIEESGKILGKFHKVGLNFNWGHYPKKFIQNRTWNKIFYLRKISLAQKVKSKIPKKYQKETQLQTVILSLLKAQKSFSRLYKKESGFKEWGLIHGDYHPGNLIFKGDKIVGIFDFDLCGFGPLIWDIGFALAHFGFHLHYEAYENIRDYFLNGYKKSFKIRYYDNEALKTNTSFAMAERLAASVVFFSDYPSKRFWKGEVTYYHYKLTELLK